jgi:hypothetical protein
MTLTLFFPLIIIYLILLIAIRGKKLNTSDAAIYLFLGFLGIVASVILASDTPILDRIEIVTITAVACAIAGGLIYRHNKPKSRIFKPINSVPTKWQNFKEAFFVSLGVFEIVVIWFITIFTWDFLSVNGIPVVTYYDLFLVGISMFSFFIFRVLVRYFKSTEDEKRCYF